MPVKNSTKTKCSFCGNLINDEDFTISGIEATICNDCIEIYYHIMDLSKHEVVKQENSDWQVNLSPQQIYKELDQVVIGQELAKKTLAVALFNHFKRLKNPQANLEKANILMIGPSGTGKTLLAKTMASILKLPFVICDATVYTEAGYVGEDVENIILKLLQRVDFDIEKAEKGIIFIDEIDKLARKSENPSITRDVSGEGVQNSLLKIIEGNVINVPPQGGRKHPYQEYIQFDTSKVLFICAGAFEGISKMKKHLSIGFGIESIEEKKYESINNEQLLKYGIIPELLGRLPIIVKLEPLSEDDLRKILTKPKFSIIGEYQTLLAFDQIDLVFEESALAEIAKVAYHDQSGARSLRRIIEKVMLDIMYHVPLDGIKRKCIINRNIISGSERVKFNVKE